MLILALVSVVGLSTYVRGGDNKTAIPYTPVQSKIVNHTEAFARAGITTYNGSAACKSCHFDEVFQVFHSYHYQMASNVTDISGRSSVIFGGQVRVQ